MEDPAALEPLEVLHLVVLGSKRDSLAFGLSGGDVVANDVFERSFRKSDVLSCAPGSNCRRPGVERLLSCIELSGKIVVFLGKLNDLISGDPRSSAGSKRGN